MVTPREQKEMVLKYSDKNKFAEAFNTKYSGTMSFSKMAGRIRSLWDCRHKHADELAAIRKSEEEKNHTVMIPARIVSKHAPSRDTIPDVGEVLVGISHLLAEMVQLQKEQIALFKEIQGGKK